MTSSMSTRTLAGPGGPVRSGLCTAARAADPAVAACWRALPAVAVTARPRPGIQVPGVLEIDVFGMQAFDAPGTSGYPQQVGKRTAFEHNGTTLGIHSPGRPSS